MDNKQISDLIDWIDEWNGFIQMFPGYDMDPVFSPNSENVVWKSMATAGYESDKDRIMVYNFKTGQRTDLSANFDQSSANFQWNKDGSTVYFISGIKGKKLFI